MNNDLSTSENYSFFNKVKGFIQVHIIAKDRGFKYEKIADTPEFHDESAALKYWEANKERLIDTNFYNDSLVIIRKEIHNVCTKKLN
tara:strand:- start:3824 stop:4084 length:261 start_codon:yes stop_codon:yes gene_type:complete